MTSKNWFIKKTKYIVSLLVVKDPQIDHIPSVQHILNV